MPRNLTSRSTSSSWFSGTFSIAIFYLKTETHVFCREDEESIKKRELGVAFHDLHVQGLGAEASFQDTVGSLLNPFSIPEKIRQARHPSVRDILSGFEGVVRPGEMLRK